MAHWGRTAAAVMVVVVEEEEGKKNLTKREKIRNKSLSLLVT
jgi:hypothetical protein